MKTAKIRKYINNGIQTFIAFHKGSVNILLHIIGFSILWYSLYKQEWKLFAGSLIVVELGHVYNHRIGKTPYDFRLYVLFRRIFFFGLFCFGVYYFFN